MPLHSSGIRPQVAAAESLRLKAPGRGQSLLGVGSQRPGVSMPMWGCRYIVGRRSTRASAPLKRATGSSSSVSQFKSPWYETEPHRGGVSEADAGTAAMPCWGARTVQGGGEPTLPPPPTLQRATGSSSVFQFKSPWQGQCFVGRCLSGLWKRGLHAHVEVRVQCGRREDRATTHWATSLNATQIADQLNK